MSITSAVGAWRKPLLMIGVSAALVCVALLSRQARDDAGRTASLEATAAGQSDQVPPSSPASPGELDRRGTPSGTVDRAPKALPNRESGSLAARAYREHSAAATLRTIEALPPLHPDRLRLIQEVSHLCRQVTNAATAVSSVDPAGLVQAPARMPTNDVLEHGRREWDTRSRAFCRGVDTEQLSTLARLESWQAQRDLAQLTDAQFDAIVRGVASAPIDADRLVSALGRAGNDERAKLLQDPEVSKRLWDVLLLEDSPAAAENAAMLLAEVPTGPFSGAAAARGDGPFQFGKSPWDQRNVLIAAGVVFVCRRFGHCMPGSVTVLTQGPPRGEFGMTLGVEGYFRDALSPTDWRTVEALVAQLQAEAAARKGRG